MEKREHINYGVLYPYIIHLRELTQSPLKKASLGVICLDTCMSREDGNWPKGLESSFWVFYQSICTVYNDTNWLVSEMGLELGSDSFTVHFQELWDSIKTICFISSCIHMSRDTYRHKLSLSDSHMGEFLGNADECWSPQLGKKKQRASTQASHHMNLGFSLIQKDLVMIQGPPSQWPKE